MVQKPLLACPTARLSAMFILQALLICVPASPQLSDKWFFIGAAVLNPDYRQEIQKTQMVFFNLTLNLINDTMELREYHTM